MERENNKREREEAEEEKEEMKSAKGKGKAKEPLDNTSKRQHLGTYKHQKININSSSRDDDEKYNKDHECMALGVFDFPWRKESLINSISEEWCSCFDESFFFSLNNNNICTTNVEFEFPDQCLSESAETFIESIDFPSNKFEETVWSSEKEGVDCTLTSMLSHPFS